MTLDHSHRAHSKYPASGFERVANCPGSVGLSEGRSDKSTVWSIEGTKGHEALERILRYDLENPDLKIGNSEYLPLPDWRLDYPPEMISYAIQAAKFILRTYQRSPDSEILLETRVYLDFIDPEMFGTFDSAIVDHFGTLHVFDYKYGAGYAVSPRENLQLIFYAIGLAHQHQWNFSRVRLWIIQPRIKGFDGPLWWELGILELKNYVGQFREAIERVKREPDTFKEGRWCQWCKAKSVCPLKSDKTLEKAKKLFSNTPF